MRLTDTLSGASDRVTTTAAHDELQQQVLPGRRLKRGVACVRREIGDRENDQEETTTTTFIHVQIFQIGLKILGFPGGFGN